MELVKENHFKKRCNPENSESGRNEIESLPRDVALEILSRLPISSLIKFRFVNRSLNIVSCDPNLIALHFSRTPQYNPCLILHCDYHNQNQLYFVELSGQEDNWIPRKFQIPFSGLLHRFNVIASCKGLLCLSDQFYSDRIYIYNPFTRQSKELPRYREFDDQEVLLGFGYHPLAKEYKIVKIVYYSNRFDNGENVYQRFRSHQKPTKSEVQVFSLARSTWRSIGEVPYQLHRRKSEALVNGRIHWLKAQGSGRRVGIASFDLADEKFREVPGPENGGFNRLNYNLAVLGGYLSAISCYHHRKIEIWIMKEYGAGESWNKHLSFRCYIRPVGTQNRILSWRIPQLVCLLDEQVILMEYDGGVLVSHDLKDGTSKEMIVEGIPSLHQAFVHVGSLGWIDNPPTLS